MYCQLDQVGEILNIAGAAKNAVYKDVNGDADFTALSFKASSIIFGLLLLKEHDVFIKKGKVSFNGVRNNYYWVELYLDGLPFIITVTCEAAPEVLFLPEEEAGEEYGFLPEKDHELQPADCEEGIWQAALEALGINRYAHQVLEDIMAIQ